MLDELGEPVLEGVRSVGGPQLVGQCGEAFEIVGDEGQDQRVACREVAIQRAAPDAGAAGDVVHRCAHPVLDEGLVGDLEQSLPVAAGVGM